ncbi:formate dehydrogenase (NAD+) [Xylographa trunciseda]|nr:formate dehydrogenase (NAD+) [Xylographa trunciseda]
MAIHFVPTLILLGVLFPYFCFATASLDLCPLNATELIGSTNVTWGSVLNVTIREIGGSSYLRPDIGGALLPYVYTIIVIIIHLPVVIIRVVRWQKVQTWSLAATVMTLAVTIQGYASTKFSPERVLTWTPLLLIIDAGSMAQVLFLIIEDRRLLSRLRHALLGPKKGEDVVLLNPVPVEQPYGAHWSYPGKTMDEITQVQEIRSFQEAHEADASDSARPEDTPILRDDSFYVAILAFLLLVAVVVLQCLGLDRALRGVRGSTPIVSWCCPIFQPFGIAVLDGNCDIYPINQNFVKGVGCIEIPGVRQMSWLKATAAGTAIGLILELVDICLLTFVHTKTRWRGMKMRRPWCTMFGGLTVLGLILVYGINYASTLPPGISAKIWVVQNADEPTLWAGELTAAGLRGAMIGWNDGIFTVRWQGKVLLVLYDGGEHGRDVPEMLGTTENELGIRPWLEEHGHTLVTTSDKEGENSKFDQELVDAEVIITTPFHPGYLTAERLANAKKLKLAITAGIGSDHVDLDAANKTNGGITVAEVTGSNVVSVAEHVVMTILTLVRNFVPAHEQIQAGEWNVAAVAKNEYDLEGKVVGTVAVGRIGERVLRRLKPFDCKELLYFDYQPLKPEIEKEIGCRRVDTLEEMLGQCDVVTINCPLHEKTRGLFNKQLISKMKKGAWLVNTARGAIVVKEDVADALKSGHLRGYGGDVWFPQPAPKDHPLRYAKNPFGGGNAMVPHMSGTSIDAQQRYAAGTRAILDSYFSGREDYRPQDLIVHKGDYATKAYGQRNAAAPGLH